MFAQKIIRGSSLSLRNALPSGLSRVSGSISRNLPAQRWVATHAHQVLNSSTYPLRCVSRWPTVENLPLSKQSLHDIFLNLIPTIEIPDFLNPSECQKLFDVVATHQMGAYSGMIPPVGRIGITQFEHQQDKDLYFSQAKDAEMLLQRFLRESNVDIISRVCDTIKQFTSLPVRIAREGDKEYFAGLVRCINSTALIHADYGPYDGPSWEIGQISAQLTWNILLKQVSGGETIIYDRPWQGESDNLAFGKPLSYGYSAAVAEGRTFKVLPPKEGSLTIFNSRNFHEVKPIDKPLEEQRYTVSSFIGLLPESAPNGPAIILWS